MASQPAADIYQRRKNIERVSCCCFYFPLSFSFLPTASTFIRPADDELPYLVCECVCVSMRFRFRLVILTHWLELSMSSGNSVLLATSHTCQSAPIEPRAAQQSTAAQQCYWSAMIDIGNVIYTVDSLRVISAAVGCSRSRSCCCLQSAPTMLIIKRV